MKNISRIIAVFLLAALNTSAGTHYVSLRSTNPMPPYTTWATAATNIQQAVAAAATGDEIVVTNGVYPGGVLVTSHLTLRSINGPQFTVINGGGTNQCISLYQDASLSGVTLTNGYSISGGGVGCSVTNAFLTNCTVAGNSAQYGGGRQRARSTTTAKAILGSFWGQISTYNM